MTWIPILLSPPPRCWEYRCVPPHLARNSSHKQASGPWVQGQLGLHNEFQASQGCISRPCFKSQHNFLKTCNINLIYEFTCTKKDNIQKQLLGHDKSTIANTQNHYYLYSMLLHHFKSYGIITTSNLRLKNKICLKIFHQVTWEKYTKAFCFLTFAYTLFFLFFWDGSSL